MLGGVKDYMVGSFIRVHGNKGIVLFFDLPIKILVSLPAFNMTEAFIPRLYVVVAHFSESETQVARSTGNVGNSVGLWEIFGRKLCKQIKSSGITHINNSCFWVAFRSAINQRILVVAVGNIIG